MYSGLFICDILDVEGLGIDQNDRAHFTYTKTDWASLTPKENAMLTFQITN